MKELTSKIKNLNVELTHYRQALFSKHPLARLKSNTSISNSMKCKTILQSTSEIQTCSDLGWLTFGPVPDGSVCGICPKSEQNSVDFWWYFLSKIGTFIRLVQFYDIKRSETELNLFDYKRFGFFSTKPNVFGFRTYSLEFSRPKRSKSKLAENLAIKSFNFSALRILDVRFSDIHCIICLSPDFLRFCFIKKCIIFRQQPLRCKIVLMW